MTTSNLIMGVLTIIVFGILPILAYRRFIKLNDNRIKDYFDNLELPDIKIKIEYVKHDDDSDKENRHESPEKETKS